MTTTPKPAPSDDALVRVLGDVLMSHVNAPEQAIYGACREMLPAIRSLATIPAAEPVGWLVKPKRSSSAGSFFHSEPMFGENWDRKDYTVTALFASPQPARETELLEALRKIADMSKDMEHDLFSATCVAEAALRARCQP